jgi:uncharacterized protein YecT (DUF1311 family)
MARRLTLAASIVILALASSAAALEAPRASDKAALAACLKYVDDFPGNVPGIDAKPSPADHVGNAIKLAGHQPASCIDYVTELCSFESEDGQSEMGMVACADREVLVWEDCLNATYKALLDKAKPELRDGYRKMQRAWIAFRDARCGVESAMRANIDHEWNANTSCKLDATARQVLILENDLLALD